MLHQQNLGLGSLVFWNEEDYAVLALSPPYKYLLSRLIDGTRIWVDGLVLADELEPLPGARDDFDPIHVISAVQPITKNQKKEAEWWAAHVNEVLYQVTDPDDPTLLPREGYDDPRITRRRALKVRELALAGHPISARRFFDKEQRYIGYGLHGLLDGRRHSKGTSPTDPRVRDAVAYVLAATRSGATITGTQRCHMIRAHLLVHHLADPVRCPSDATLRRLMKKLDVDGLAEATADRRRSEANKPKHAPTPVSALTPGQYVEVDVTRANIMTIMPSGKTRRCQIIVAIDLATRSILAFDIIPVSTTGQDDAALLARMLRPTTCRKDAPADMLLENSRVLPRADMIALDPRQAGALALPYIVPDCITTDRGKDFLSNAFVAACLFFGISIPQAPAYSPAFKPHIERALGTIDKLWMMTQPGYIGRSKEHRGREWAREELKTVQQLRESFEEWWVRIYQNRPHEGLILDEYPGRCFSPNQMYRAMFDAGASMPVPIDENTYISLLPVKRKVIRTGGIKHNNRMYRHPLVNELRLMPPPTKHGKWDVHIDPYRPHILKVKHPDTGAWLTWLPATPSVGEHVFASSLRQLGVMAPADDQLQQDYAVSYYVERELAIAERASRTERMNDKHTVVIAQREADDNPLGDPLPPPPPAHAPDEGHSDFSLFVPPVISHDG